MEYISDALVPLFQYLESEVISDVAQRVKATTAFTRTAELEAQALYELGYSPAAIRKKVMKKLNANPEYRKLVAKNTLEHKNKVKKLLRDIQKEAYKAGEKLFAQSGDLSFLDDLRIWKLGNKEITDSSFLPKLVKAMEMQTRGELKNLTRTTGFKTMAGMESLQTVYRKELDQAVIKIATGTFSQEQVIYDVIHNLANSGLRSIDYKTGRTMQLDSAVRLATRTGTHQLMGKIAEQNIRETGTDMVYVSSHWGARNTGQGHANHAKWQGQVYRTGSSITEGDAKKEAERIGQSEIKDLWEATGYCMDGTHENDPKGLYGYNCRHRIYPWFIGVSSLPDEEPEPEPVTIDGKQYDYYAMSQKQRAKESRIRALKREREAMQKLGMDTKEVQKKIKDKIKEYEQFCKDYNMPEKYNRIRYDNGTGEYKKTKAWREYEEKHKADMESIAKAEGSELFRKGSTYRKKSAEGVEIVDEPTYNKLIKPVLKNGGIVIRGTPEAEEHLAKMGASASTITDVILFSKNVTVSDVLEETYHFKQNMKGLNDDKDTELRTILNEIDAKKYLISVAEKYHIPESEQNTTKNQLESYREALSKYYENHTHIGDSQ